MTENRRRYIVEELGEENVIMAATPRGAASRALTRHRDQLGRKKFLHVRRIGASGELTQGVSKFAVIHRQRSERERSRALELLKRSVDRMRKSARRLSGTRRSDRMREIKKYETKKRRSYKSDGKFAFLK